jgi:fumarate reductase flavoprotein subunit
LTTIELGMQLEVAQAMAHSAFERRESRGAHQRLDGYEARDDVNFLKHSLATRVDGGPPRIHYGDVRITHLPPGRRAYGAEGERAEREANEARTGKAGSHGA